MKRASLVLSLAIASVAFGCTRSREEKSTPTPPAPTESNVASSSVSSPSRPIQPSPSSSAASSDGPLPLVHQQGEVVEEGQHYPIHLASFSLEKYRVRVVDIAASSRLRDALEHEDDMVAINGGYFGPVRDPLGLVVSEGVELSKLSTSMSGGIVAINGSHAELLDVDHFTRPNKLDFAIQCMPRLVVHGEVNIKKSDGRSAERSALCLRQRGTTLDLIVTHGSDRGGGRGPTLFGLAHALKGLGCEDALNLDGGPSTGIAWRENETVQELAARGSLRHALVVSKRR